MEMVEVSKVSCKGCMSSAHPCWSGVCTTDCLVICSFTCKSAATSTACSQVQHKPVSFMSDSSLHVTWLACISQWSVSTQQIHRHSNDSRRLQTSILLQTCERGWFTCKAGAEGMAGALMLFSAAIACTTAACTLLKPVLLSGMS